MKVLRTVLVLVLGIGFVVRIGADVTGPPRALPPRAAVASAHPAATAAGRAVLESGGNAFDAAIAVAAALAVVEPYSSGIGGGAFFLVHRAADGKTTMIDARERAPAAATSRYVSRFENG